jgi:ribonuclease J
VQREVEVGLQRRLRRELQVDPLIICLVQPAPAGTPAYKGRADSEPDTRPAPRGRRDGGVREVGVREVGRPVRSDQAAPQRQLVTAAATAAPVSAPAPAAATTEVADDPDVSGRIRRRRSAAVAG